MGGKRLYVERRYGGRYGGRFSTNISARSIKRFYDDLGIRSLWMWKTHEGKIPNEIFFSFSPCTG